MMVLCIKSVVMDISGEVALSKGTTYEAVVTDWGIETTNDSGHHHIVYMLADDASSWDWFVEHFS